MEFKSEGRMLLALYRCEATQTMNLVSSENAAEVELIELLPHSGHMFQSLTISQERNNIPVNNANLTQRDIYIFIILTQTYDKLAAGQISCCMFCCVAPDMLRGLCVR
jgi:hypothetical protein